MALIKGIQDGLSGGGLRDDQGNFVANFSNFDGHCNNTIDETRPILDGITLYISLNLNHILIQSDSKVLVDILVRQDRDSSSIWY